MRWMKWMRWSGVEWIGFYIDWFIDGRGGRGGLDDGMEQEQEQEQEGGD